MKRLLFKIPVYVFQYVLGILNVTRCCPRWRQGTRLLHTVKRFGNISVNRWSQVIWRACVYL